MVEDSPVERRAIAAGQDGAFRGAGVENQSVGGVFISRDSSEILRAADMDRLHHGQTKAALEVQNALRRFLAVKLEHVGARRLDGCIEKGVVGVDRQGDPDRPPLRLGAERHGVVQREIAGAWRKEDEADHIGAGVQRRLQRLRGRQATNLDQQAHGRVHSRNRVKAAPKIRGLSSRPTSDPVFLRMEVSEWRRLSRRPIIRGHSTGADALASSHSHCPVCLSLEGATVSETDRHGKPLTTRLCGDCGHVFNDPIPTAEELAAFYARDYRVSYKGAERPSGRQIARNFGRVERYWRKWGHVMRSHPRVLDIGAGSGEFLFFAKALGHETEGVEPNVGYSAYCRDELALPVRTASVEDLEGAEATYDFIRLNHVLEHMRDPVESLERAARLLAPNGVLYVEVPDVLGYAATKSGGRIFHYGHISNFSPWTLRAAAGRAGLAELAETASATQNQASAFSEKERSGLWSGRAMRAMRSACAPPSPRTAADRHPPSRSRAYGAEADPNIDNTRIAIGIGAPRQIGMYYLKRFTTTQSSGLQSGMVSFTS